jgi:hypothetical protein
MTSRIYGLYQARCSPPVAGYDAIFIGKITRRRLGGVLVWLCLRRPLGWWRRRKVWGWRWRWLSCPANWAPILETLVDELTAFASCDAANGAPYGPTQVSPGCGAACFGGALNFLTQKWRCGFVDGDRDVATEHSVAPKQTTSVRLKTSKTPNCGTANNQERHCTKFHDCLL